MTFVPEPSLGDITQAIVRLHRSGPRAGAPKLTSLRTVPLPPSASPTCPERLNDARFLAAPGGHHLVVVGGTDQSYTPVAVVRCDADQASVIGMAPAGFEAMENALVDGRPLVLGTIDSTPAAASSDELGRLVVPAGGHGRHATRDDHVPV